MKKVIWITGGSSGIGKAVALKFANKGWQVIISSRREEVLKDISDKNENIDYLKLDIVDYEACNSVFKTILEKYNKAYINRDFIISDININCMRMTSKMIFFLK